MEDFHYLEERKEEYLKGAYDAFNILTKLAEQASQNGQDIDSDDESNEGQDEKWLYYYILGKISEKRHEEPKIYLDFYLNSAKSLYEKGATYPLKINHMNPSNLAIEALELYYRTTAAIVKYLEQNYSSVSRPNFTLFTRVLRDLANSPFAINRAKIKGAAALKRKMMADAASKSEEPATKVVINGGENGEAVTVTPSVSSTSNNEVPTVDVTSTTTGEKEVTTTTDIVEPISEDQVTTTTTENVELTKPPINGKPLLNGIIDETNTRRSSQESGVTSTTSTNDSSSSSSSSSSGSDSSSDSDSDSSEDDQIVKSSEIDTLFKSCIRNLEECVTRFPEHYKSTYRLVYHFLHAKGSTKSLSNCHQLLLSTYRTTLGSNITGLFTERKTNNLFNGVWRIPSDEIDRPGNFSAHLSKCVITLLDVLKQQHEYSILFDVALLLYKNPESDKKYLIEQDKKELYQQALLYSSISLKAKFKAVKDEKNDAILLKFLIDIFKINRKIQKFIQLKESPFNSVMIEAYRAYVAEKAVIPEGANIVDLATKLCVYELNMIKQREKDKQNQSLEGEKPVVVSEATTPFIPGLTKKKVDKPKRAPFGPTVGPLPSSTTNSTQSVPVIPANSDSPPSGTAPKSTTVPPVQSIPPIIPPSYNNLLPNPTETSAAAAAAMIAAATAKNNNNPSSSVVAPFDQAALLSEIYKTPSLLASIPGMNLTAMLNFLQQQNEMYSRLAATVNNTNYSNFALKYIESLAGNLMTSISAVPPQTVDALNKPTFSTNEHVKSPVGSPLNDLNKTSSVNMNVPGKSNKQKSTTNSNQLSKKKEDIPIPKKKQVNTNKHSSINHPLTPLSLPIDLPSSLSITRAVSISPKPKQQQHNRTEQRPSSASPSSSKVNNQVIINPVNQAATLSPVTISRVSTPTNLKTPQPSTKSTSTNKNASTNKLSSTKQTSGINASSGVSVKALEKLNKLGSSISLVPEKDSKLDTPRPNSNKNFRNAYLLEFARQISINQQNTIDLTDSPTTPTKKNTSKSTSNKTAPASNTAGSIRVKKDSKLFDNKKNVSGIQIPDAISVSPIRPAHSPSPNHLMQASSSGSLSGSKMARITTSTKSYPPPGPSSLQFRGVTGLASSVSPSLGAAIDIR